MTVVVLGKRTEMDSDLVEWAGGDCAQSSCDAEDEVWMDSSYEGCGRQTAGQQQQQQQSRKMVDAAEVEMMKERFSKLLLGEDMSGGSRGVCPALAISNAITNLSVSLFGEGMKLRPLSKECKRRWRIEMDMLLCVCDHIVELKPSWQISPNGSRQEVMVPMQRDDLKTQLPALRKLDDMLLEMLDDCTSKEYWYEHEQIEPEVGDSSARFSWQAPDDESCRLEEEDDHASVLHHPSSDPENEGDEHSNISGAHGSSQGENHSSSVSHIQSRLPPGVRFMQGESVDDFRVGDDGYSTGLTSPDSSAGGPFISRTAESSFSSNSSSSHSGPLDAVDYREDAAPRGRARARARARVRGGSGGSGCGAGGQGVSAMRKSRSGRWWRPVPCVRDGVGLSENGRKQVEKMMEKTNQMVKLAMAINSQVLDDMAVPAAYSDNLPKSGRAALGDQIYLLITGTSFSVDRVLETVDLNHEHSALELACKLEAAVFIWTRYLNNSTRAAQYGGTPSSSHGHGGYSMGMAMAGASVGGSSRDVARFEESSRRAEACLHILKQRCPNLSQTSLETSKILYNTDVGKAILEGYSRVLEGVASNIRSRIDDVLQADSYARRPDDVTETQQTALELNLQIPDLSFDSALDLDDAALMYSDWPNSARHDAPRPDSIKHFRQNSLPLRVTTALLEGVSPGSPARPPHHVASPPNSTVGTPPLLRSVTSPTIRHSAALDGAQNVAQRRSPPNNSTGQNVLSPDLRRPGGHSASGGSYWLRSYGRSFRRGSHGTASNSNSPVPSEPSRMSGPLPPHLPRPKSFSVDWNSVNGENLGTQGTPK